MPDDFTQLLGATIQHLESLKERGLRFVNVSPEHLAGLTAGPAKSIRQPGSPFDLVTPGRSRASAPVDSPTAADPAKMAAFADLRARALACVKCPNLASSRKQVVFGVGNVDAALMFVGE